MATPPNPYHTPSGTSVDIMSLLVEHRGEVVHLVLNRPDPYNATHPILRHELLEERAGQDLVSTTDEYAQGRSAFRERGAARIAGR